MNGKKKAALAAIVLVMVGTMYYQGQWMKWHNTHCDYDKSKVAVLVRGDNDECIVRYVFD